MKTLLCLAHTFKGEDFLREAKEQGCRVILLTRNKFRASPWPWDCIDEFYTMESLDQALPLVCELFRHRSIDLIFGLQEHDVERAARLREHLCLTGMSCESAYRFRDKLCMREVTTRAGVPNPEFVHTLNHQDLRDYTQRVKPPWMLKPRSEAGSLGIVRIESEAELWQALHRLGDEASHYLLEQRMHGDVFHVDSLVHQSEVCFSQAHRYGVPPFQVWNRGGVFWTASLGADDPILQDLLSLNHRAIRALGLKNGVAHVEFIQCAQGQILFLEAAARVGGANIDVLVERATGVNLWREWLKLELQGSDYRPPTRCDRSAVLMQCLSREKHPNLSALEAEEIVWKLDLEQHAGLIVCSAHSATVKSMAERCLQELQQEHLAVLPPPKKSI